MTFQVSTSKTNYTTQEGVVINITADQGWQFVMEDSTGYIVYGLTTGSGNYQINTYPITTPGTYLLTLMPAAGGNIATSLINIVQASGGNGTGTELSTYELRLSYANLGWGTVTGLENKLTEIANAVNPLVVPLGYTFLNKATHDVNAKTVSLYYQGHSPAIPLVAILAVIAGILFAIGFVITALGWYKESSALQDTTQTKNSILTQAQNEYTKGTITKSQYDTIVSSLDTLDLSKTKGTDWTTIAIIAGGAIVLAALLSSGMLGGKR